MSMTQEEACAYVGGWVRVLNDNNEYSGAKIESVNGKSARVRYVGGKLDHDVALSKLQPWKARNAQAGFTPAVVPPVRATPIKATADEPPAVKGGIVEPLSDMVARMSSVERELDDLIALEKLCKADYDAAKAEADRVRSVLADIRKDLKLRLGL